MAEDNVFDSNNNANANPNSNAALAGEDVSAYVGDGKKFRTVKDLYNGKQEADAFITQLQREMGELRADLARRANAEDQLTQIRSEFEEFKRNQNIQPREHTNPELTASQIEELVKNSVTRIEQSRTAGENAKVVNAGLIKHFGDVDKARKALTDASVEVGMSVEELKDIASRSPSAFFSLMGIQEPKQPANATGANLDTTGGKNPLSNAATGNDANKPGTKPYYDAIRKENPSLYHSAKIQNEIFQAVKAGTYVLS